MVRSGSWCVFLLLLSIHRFSVVSSASWSPGAFTTSTTSLLFSTPTQQPHPAPPFENRKEQGVVVDPETSIGNLHHLIRDNQKTSAIASSSARKSHWNAVACVALANFVVYTFRPYDYISWQVRPGRFPVNRATALVLLCPVASGAFVGIIRVIYNNFLFSLSRSQMRFPRACWELSILVVSKLAGDSPTLCLLLALMTGSTALTDIFIWSPLFASFATFQTCSGGWFSGRPYHCVSDYTMGFGRLLVRFYNE